MQTCCLHSDCFFPITWRLRNDMKLFFYGLAGENISSLNRRHWRVVMGKTHSVIVVLSHWQMTIREVQEGLMVHTNYWHCLPCAGVMVGQRLRRWPNIKPTQGQVLEYSGLLPQFGENERTESELFLYLGVLLEWYQSHDFLLNANLYMGA